MCEGQRLSKGVAQGYKQTPKGFLLQHPETRAPT